MRNLLLLMSFLCISGLCRAAEDRETKVRNDRQRVEEDDSWIYNDLAKGLAEAKRTGKPLLVVFRCIPCEACAQFDEQVFRRDPQARQLMDQFVCLRIVHANGMDLSLFQFDFDQSFAAFMMNADKTIYGRFATRSASKDESQDMTMEGFARALEVALELHRDYPNNKRALAGKQSDSGVQKPAADVRVPEEYPSLQGKYGSELNYAGNVVKSCIHCHQVREADRAVYRAAGKPLPDHVLRPYPLPQTIGMTLDARTRSTIKNVAPDTPAANAGLKAGDEIVSINEQPILSIADVQWVLHNAGPTAELKFVLRRDDAQRTQMLALAEGWREASDISWRPTSWDLRRIATGGLVLETLPEEDRERLDLPADQMTLRVNHVGQYGEHAAGKQAGFQKGDIVISYDGRNDLRTESDLFAYVLQDEIKPRQAPVTVLRGDKKLELKLPVR